MPSAWSALRQATIGALIWAVGLVVIMLFGGYVIASDSAPSWRAFISLWCFASAPWAVLSVIYLGWSLIGFGEDVGRVLLAVSLAVILAGTLWEIAVQVHAVRHAFDSESTARSSILVVAVWALQSASGYVL
ncbi:MAG: hypothetical protein OXL37_09865 [Chloroflexota bacterium]|nr:hypothetical protein [Chloroflexota bacterium]MDE2960696.1 hypothetical protein [Chloroflexota bacterium]